MDGLSVKKKEEMSLRMIAYSPEKVVEYATCAKTQEQPPRFVIMSGDTMMK